MELKEIRDQLAIGLETQNIELQADGNKLFLQIVSGVFEGLSKVKRQQKVYAMLNERIQSGEIHAVVMTTLSPEEADNRD